MKRIIQFSILFLFSLTLLNAQDSRITSDDVIGFKADSTDSSVIVEDIVGFKDQPVQLFTSVRVGGNWTSYKYDDVFDVSGTGLTTVFSLTAHSTVESGWYLSVDLGYQTTSVSFTQATNVRRSGYFGKAYVGITDGQYLGAGVTGGYFGSDQPMKRSSLYFGGFMDFKYPITDRIWVTARGDVGAMMTDRFTMGEKNPFSGSATLGFAYNL